MSAGASNASAFQISGTLLLAIKDSAGMLSVVTFTMGALMYYYVLLSIKTHPPVVIRLGYCGSCIIAFMHLANDIWPANSIFDGLHFVAASNRLAGNGSGGLADR